MSVPIKLLCIVIVISSFSICMVSIFPVKAIVPQVQGIIVWNSGGDTILNITIYHDPVTTFHHVDKIEVDVEGSITSFPVDQPSSTFTTQINLGQITGTPSSNVRAHCTIDGWSSWSETFQIPEFPNTVILAMLLTITAIVVVLLRRKIKGIPIGH